METNQQTASYEELVTINLKLIEANKFLLAVFLPGFTDEVKGRFSAWGIMKLIIDNITLFNEIKKDREKLEAKVAEYCKEGNSEFYRNKSLLGQRVRWLEKTEADPRNFRSFFRMLEVFATFPDKEGVTSNFTTLISLEDQVKINHILKQIWSAIREKTYTSPEMKESYHLVLNKQINKLLLLTAAQFLQKSSQVSSNDLSLNHFVAEVKHGKQTLRRASKRKMPILLILQAERENSRNKILKQSEVGQVYAGLKPLPTQHLLEEENELTLADLLEEPVPKIDGPFLSEEKLPPVLGLNPLITAESWIGAASTTNYCQDVTMKPLDLGENCQTPDKQPQRPDTGLTETSTKSLSNNKQNNLQS